MYAVVRRGRIVLFKLREFLLELLADGLRPFLCLGFGAELLELFLLVHPEFLLDGTELVVKVIFPLLLIDVTLDLLVDLLLDLQQLNLGVKHLQKFHRPKGDVIDSKQLDLLHEVLDLHGRGDEVHKEGVVVD